MAYVITITDGNGNKLTVEVSYEIFRFEKNYSRQEIRHLEESKENLSYEGFCELNDEYYMEIPEQLTTSSCETEIMNNFSAEELHKAIDRLPEKQRRRFILYFVNGLTFEEIAAAERTVHSAIVESIQTALSKLRKIIGSVEI